MDPLSVTASIISVVQLITSLVSYLNDARHATSEQKALRHEAASLLSLLISLRDRVEEAQADDEWFTQVRSLGVQNGPLDQFKDVLERLVDDAGISNNSRTKDLVKSALKWRFTKSEVEASLKQVERLKSLIHIALSNDAFKLSQAIYDKVSDTNLLTQQVQISVEQLYRHVKQDVRATFSRWLKVPDSSTNYRAAQKKRYPNTGSWLVASKAFEVWKTSTRSLLWLHGKAGCGKTVLSATVLEYILSEAIVQSKSAVSYFYFDFNDVEKRRPCNAIRSLLYQFALQLPGGIDKLQQLHETCNDGRDQPADDQVRSLLYELIKYTKQKYIILDALDECHDRDELLTFIEDLMEASQHNVCVLVTSRPEVDIDASLRPISEHAMDIESAVVDADIKLYVRGRLATDKKLCKWPSNVKDEIAEELMKKANGMFRWAYCQLEALRGCVNRRALKAALSSLPITLDDTYTRMIDEITSRGQLYDALKILRWLCYSYRPLLLSELVDVLAIENGDDEQSGYDPDERPPDPQDVVAICASLISCSGSDDTIAVRLAHFSVKEYLLSERCTLVSEFQSTVCHSIIAESCLQYLDYISRQPFSTTDDTVRTYPLAGYSAKFWCQHAREIGSNPPMPITDLIYNSFIRPPNLLVWRRLHANNNGRPASWGPEIPLKIEHLDPPLYYAASLGFLEVTRRIIEQGADVNAEGGAWGRALQTAAANGHEMIVEMLLQAGAEVDAYKYGHYATPLQAASVQGHAKVVEMLLDAGAKVNAEGVNAGGVYGDALQAASIRGHEKTVQTLLDRGADINAHGGYYGNALHAAVKGNQEKVVQMLVDAGADVNARTEFDGTALQVCANSGQGRIVEILIKAGADTNAREDGLPPALYIASDKGHLKIAKLLLEAGADMNVQEENPAELLEAMSARGNAEIVQFLLKAGVDVNARNMRGRCGSALVAASKQGRERVVDILLKNGADVNPPAGSYYLTPLQVAAFGCHEKTTELLLAAGAEVKVRGEDIADALKPLSIPRYEKITQMLIKARDERSSC